jgi:hypothetical protein
MNSKPYRWGMPFVMMALTIWGVSVRGNNSNGAVGIPPDIVADYVHAVIESDRTFYTIHVVERLQNKGVIVASENWRVTDTLPLPVQFLREAGELGVQTGMKFQYRLIGLSPINPENGPASEFERKGLEEVQRQPDRPYTGIITKGDERSFAAIYADRAVSESCIGCHNAHPQSRKRNFRMHDVMGAIAITIPLSYGPR